MLLGLIFDCAVEWQEGDYDNHEVGPAPATIYVGCFTPPSLSRDGASPPPLPPCRAMGRRLRRSLPEIIIAA